jgi:hypothetical protein
LYAIFVHLKILKKKALHIAFRFLLIANLLFSQFAVNLFHDRHDVHEQSLELQTGESALQKHGEHCKVCSLDIVFNLLAHSTIQLKDPTTGIAQPLSFNVEEELTSFSFSQDRAPPIFS